MFIVNLIIVLILFLLTGFLSGRYQDKYLFAKSFLISVGMVISGFLSLIISGFIIYWLLIRLLGDRSSIFVLGIIIILLAGIMNYFIVHQLIKWNDYNEMLVAILEYYIQWTTIFFTLYQFLTSSPQNLKSIAKLEISTDTLDLNLLNIIILPVLLISWIALAMVRLYIKDHKWAEEESEAQDEENKENDSNSTSRKETSGEQKS
ncbi:SA1002 family membrane protein [Staphylococcus debuckii]|uniref:SA1002 family membrane protein n=1 Tax=Staphylococcus debuckii TaxID=2044912 RepID=UPI000F433D30|nr:hypothetical protein [Staphylococcus debuckii]AYU56070.1 hypothetical protein CNQ82_11750 [Staphylococcus debuckii]